MKCIWDSPSVPSCRPSALLSELCRGKSPFCHVLYWYLKKKNNMEGRWEGGKPEKGEPPRQQLTTKQNGKTNFCAFCSAQHVGRGVAGARQRRGGRWLFTWQPRSKWQRRTEIAIECKLQEEKGPVPYPTTHPHHFHSAPTAQFSPTSCRPLPLTPPSPPTFSFDFRILPAESPLHS